MLTHPSILERVIKPERGGFSLELARHVLGFDFPAADHARYNELSAKAQDGCLTPDERLELEDYLDVNDFLILMKAKAEVSLQQQNPAA